MDESTQVSLLEGLLNHYSPTRQEGGAVNHLVEQMQALGLIAYVDEIGNAVGTIGAGPNQIILLGHIDTVPGEIPVRREGDLLWGRGAVDAKGPLACFTAAAAAITPPPGWQVVVIGALAEEGDSRGAMFVKDKYQPQFCVIGEPSGWERVTLAYKGSAWIDYTLKKAMEHTAAAGESACEIAIRFWNDYQAAQASFNTGREKAFDQLSASLRKMHSEDDGFYQTAQLRFNLRLPPDLPPEEVMNLLTPLAGDGQLQLMDGLACYRAEKNTPLVRSLLAGIRSQGGKPGFTLKTGTSDMNIAGPAWNCPIVAYGPGDSKLDHTPEEHIQISEYLKAIKVLKHSLEGLFS